MRASRLSRALAVGLLSATLVGLTACGAGSRTGAETATKVACDFENPAEATTINVLAYNSSAVDPYSNTMVSSCTHDNVTVKHDPIDFAGQVQKTTATLAGDTGTYDVVETYSFVVPDLASRDKLVPLDDLFAKYKDTYALDDIDENLRKAMSYEGKLYALPMQTQVLTMVYRKDLFEKNNLEPPTTFAELRDVSKKLQDSGDLKYPLALPWLASGDISTAYKAALNSLGKNFVAEDGTTPEFTSAESVKAFEELKSLLPYMDPQVTTFDQPKVQQQLYNGSAAIGIMFSGRMNDLVQQKNTKLYDQFAFAAPPAVEEGGTQYGALSVDGWSIPFNTKIDHDLLFQLLAASVSEDASKASIPAAYPARKGLDQSASPYAEAAEAAIAGAPPAEAQPWVPPITSANTEIIASVISGKTSVEEGTKQMQAAAEKVLAEQK
ncbi:sorbitol/mannitol transport system substrate-binding protein [Friedmanniella luteola]|uniref:Sorbitol/mannitol transport system substrate-binding protein n=1 Tax=Friedmanniella luteola TaxID=546871 RepID=A0A1H2A4S8_9ACTN|nr:extracellular solute-binding protein [Friedmanniella luteola]SDT40998.1 sorbitol/mannitol transport system substrate-binding protein [Friedmanniella luteola]